MGDTCRWPAQFDDIELNKELVIRPVDERGRCIWHWSGSIHLRDLSAPPHCDS